MGSVYLLLALAVVELVAVIVGCRILRKKKIEVWKRLLVIILLLIVEFFTLKTAVFPPQKEIATSGQYEVTSNDYWIEKSEVGAYGDTKEIQVRAWYPVDYKGADHTAGVVVFSHGSCGTIDNNVSLYKEMASYGYVVLAVVHPGQAAVMTKSDNSTVQVS